MTETSKTNTIKGELIMIKKFIEKLLINEQKRFEDIRVYIQDTRTELNFLNDRYGRDFKNDDFVSFRKDLEHMNALADDINEYLVDLKNSKKRIDTYQKLLGLFKENEAA